MKNDLAYRIELINKISSRAIEDTIDSFDLRILEAQRIVEHSDKLADAVRTATAASLRQILGR